MKTGLVLEGGASRSLFTCGVMDVLLEEKIYADYVIGASAGISQAVSYVSRQIERNAIITQKYMGDKRYMGAAHLLDRKNRSFYNMGFVFDEIPNSLVPFDYDTYLSSNTECVAAVTNVLTGKTEYIDAFGGDKSWTALRASCALPLLFPTIEINDKKYFDGGISDSIPFEQAIKSGCDRVIAVLTRDRGYVKKTDSSVKLACAAYRKYPEFCKTLKNRAEMYNAQRKRLFELEAKGKAFIIEPISTMHIKRTENRWEKLKPLYVHGKEITKLRMEALKKYLER